MLSDRRLTAREMADSVIISVVLWFTIFTENVVIRPPSAESIPRLPAVAQKGNRLNVFTSVLQQSDVGGSFNYYRLRSRTLIGFESLPDHTHHYNGDFFFIFLCSHFTWGKNFRPRPSNISLLYKSRNFGSFVWHFYFALRSCRFNLRTEAYLTFCLYFLWVFFSTK
jgi:hypothetical protein